MARMLAAARIAEMLLAETAIRYAALVEAVEQSRDLIWSRRHGGGHARDIDGASEELVATRREPDPKCPVCLDSIMDGEVVVFDHGDLIHVDCRRERPLPRLPLRSASSRRPAPQN